MMVGLLKPVSIQRSEEIEKRLRLIETGSASDVQSVPKDAAWFRGTTSPVPEIILDLKTKYRPDDTPPIEPRAMREALAMEQDRRMRPVIVGGINPNEPVFWRRIILSEREKEEIRRVMQREQWSEREIRFVTKRFAEAALLYVAEYHRKQVRNIREKMIENHHANLRYLDKLQISRRELAAFIALENRNRIWIAELMNERATSPREIAAAHHQKLEATEEKLLERDLIRGDEKRLEEAARHLASFMAAHAYLSAKKSG
jgi:hypothetical protein